MMGKNNSNLLKEYKSICVVENDDSTIKEEETSPGVVEIFYEDFDLEKRTDILKAIDYALGERINIFEDTLVKEKIEQDLARKPIIVLTGEEIVNKMNFDF